MEQIQNSPDSEVVEHAMNRTIERPSARSTAAPSNALMNMALLDDGDGSAPFTYRKLHVPIFGTLCFFLGAGFLFLISLGRWRVRCWPTYSENHRAPLEPTRVRVGGRCYFCADVAIFVGFVLLLIAGFFVGLVALTT
jgi:hypothetical protein